MVYPPRIEYCMFCKLFPFFNFVSLPNIAHIHIPIRGITVSSDAQVYVRK